jgi:hypothetical protein
MEEGLSNSSGAPLPAGAVGQIIDVMQGVELSRRSPLDGHDRSHFLTENSTGSLYCAEISIK